MKQLFLMRHAAAQDYAPGRRDADRELTAAGVAQAAAAGRFLREHNASPQVIISSSAARAQQTAHHLGLGVPIRLDPSLYAASTHSIREAIYTLDDAISSVLVVAHAPGLPALVHELIDRDDSRLAQLRSGFPTAAIVCTTLDGDWLSLATTSGILGVCGLFCAPA